MPRKPSPDRDDDSETSVAHPSSDRAEPLRLLSQRVWIVSLNVLAILAILFVLYETRRVVAWILIALLLALALEPAVELLQRKRWKRGWAIVAVLAGIVGFLVLLVATLVPMLAEQGKSLAAAAPEMLETLKSTPLVQWVDARFDLIDRAKGLLSDNAGAAAGPMLAVMQGVFAGVIGAVTVFVLTIFMLVFGGELLRGALQWIEPEKRPRYAGLAQRIRSKVGGYVSGTIFIALIGGVVTAVALAILGVPYFLALGLLMALLGVLPFIGSTLGGILVVGTTFLSSGTQAGVIALVVFLAYQQAENHLLQPLVQRKSIHMNALFIAVIMLIGTTLAGVLGALLALPVAAAIQVVMQDVLERRKERWALAGVHESGTDDDASGETDTDASHETDDETERDGRAGRGSKTPARGRSPRRRRGSGA